MDNRQYLEVAYIANRNKWMQFNGTIKVDPVKNIPNKNSDGSQWKVWHEALKDNFGKKIANSLFLKAWKIQSSSKASSSDLRKYLEKNGMIIEKGILESAVDTGSDVFDNIGDFLQVGKYVVFSVAGITVLGLAMIIFNIAKNPIGAAKTAALFSPAGPAVAASGGIK